MDTTYFTIHEEFSDCMYALIILFQLQEISPYVLINIHILNEKPLSW